MEGKEMIGKAEVFFSRNSKVHISLKNRRFYNGLILEVNKKKGFIIVKDDLIGEVPIMFEEIFLIEPFLEEGFKDGR